MKPVKSFDLVGTGSDHGGSVHVEWDCDARFPNGDWGLWNDYVTEFVDAALDDSRRPYEAARNMLEGIAFDLTYEWYKDIPQLIKNWKEAMVKIMAGISWHECEVCGWLTFMFCNPFKETIEERGACDCTNDDFTDMMVEAEND